MTNPEANSLASPESPDFVDLASSRLDLVAMHVDSLLCQQANAPHMRRDLGRLLHAAVPDTWPHENWESHVLAYLLNLIASDPEAMGWCRYLMLRHNGGVRTLIGTAGCGFPNPETGEAEFGYGLLPEYQRQGFAAEAVRTLLPWIRTRRPVRTFIAHTFPHLRGSIRVLEKCGFAYDGPGLEEGTVRYREPSERASTPPRQ